MAGCSNQPIIRRLEESVVNRIAAGEVVQRPANGLKEMLENSLDAGSTSITVTIKSGGLKMLQISDNGHGIRREDMEIVCERFTTSKLREFNDLRSIATFGFRGEALASISHVAHLTICTRTKDSKCAYKASYADGKLKAPPRPTAGNQGTQITVEDLFFNVPARRRALTNFSEEHQKIADVVSRYAIHNSGISMMLRKAGQSNTAAGNISVRTHVGASVCDNIAAIYGSQIAKDLIEVVHNDEKLQFKVSGYISNANCSSKKFNFLLFINHRLVDCTSLKRALDTVYQAYLPKGSHPFVYLALEITPCNVDVNVHPTKHEVHFLHEEEIVESVQKAVDRKLLGCNSSRTFYTQTFLPTAPGVTVTDVIKEKNGKSAENQARIYEHQMVRTDSKLQKLDAFIMKPSNMSPSSAGILSPSQQFPSEAQSPQLKHPNKNSEEHQEICAKYGSPRFHDPKLNSARIAKRRQIKLTSILKLQAEIKSDVQQDLVNLIGDHTWVGCINPEQALIQHSTKLYLSDTRRLSEELFYQILIFDFGNFGLLKFSQPIPIYDIALLALENGESGWKPTDGNKEDLAAHIKEFFKQKSEMLSDYFSFDVDEKGQITGIPMLLPNYVPAMEGLPMLVLRLTTEVNWESEKECFETFCRECARFYSVRKGHIDLEDVSPREGSKLHEKDMKDDESNSKAASASLEKNMELETLPCNNTSSWKWTLEHVIYRALQTYLLPSTKMLDDGTFLQLANLPDLYKVFERC